MNAFQVFVNSLLQRQVVTTQSLQRRNNISPFWREIPAGMRRSTVNIADDIRLRSAQALRASPGSHHFKAVERLRIASRRTTLRSSSNTPLSTSKRELDTLSGSRTFHTGFEESSWETAVCGSTQLLRYDSTKENIEKVHFTVAATTPDLHIVITTTV